MTGQTAKKNLAVMSMFACISLSLDHVAFFLLVFWIWLWNVKYIKKTCLTLCLTVYNKFFWAVTSKLILISKYVFIFCFYIGGLLSEDFWPRFILAISLRISFRNLVKSNWNQIVFINFPLIIRTRRNTVWCEINRKMINTI